MTTHCHFHSFIVDSPRDGIIVMGIQTLSRRVKTRGGEAVGKNFQTMPVCILATALLRRISERVKRWCGND
jgi:hypothetical protein